MPGAVDDLRRRALADGGKAGIDAGQEIRGHARLLEPHLAQRFEVAVLVGVAAGAAGEVEEEIVAGAEHRVEALLQSLACDPCQFGQQRARGIRRDGAEALDGALVVDHPGRLRVGWTAGSI